jgi:hypothetical protein
MRSSGDHGRTCPCGDGDTYHSMTNAGGYLAQARQ